jgi:hypothetical protein
MLFLDETDPLLSYPTILVIHECIRQSPSEVLFYLHACALLLPHSNLFTMYISYFFLQSTMRLAQLDKIAERLSHHVMGHYEEMGMSGQNVQELSY